MHSAGSIIQGHRQSVMRHPGFRRLWAANLSGGLGQQVAVLALSVTAVHDLHASAIELGVITALGYAANLVLGIPIGVWVDRWQKKRVLVLSDAARAVAVLSIPVAYLFGALSIAQLMLVAIVVGTATVYFDTARTSILPALVARDRVSEASARLQTSDATIGVVGPGLAGQLLRLVGGPLLYFVTAGTQLISALLVALIRIDEPRVVRAEREPFWASLGAGLAFVVRHPVLRTFMLTNAAINLGAGVFMAIVPIFVLRQLAISPALYGLVISAGSVGGVIGSLCALWVKRHLGELRTRSISNYVLPLAFTILPLAPFMPIPPAVTVGAAEFAFGLIIVMGSVAAAGIRAKITPHQLMGRVTAASRFVTYGVLPIGSLIGGAVATAAGNEAGLWLAVALAAVGALFTLFSPIRTMRDLPPHLEAHDAHAEADV